MNSREIYFSDENYRDSFFAHFKNSNSDTIKNKPQDLGFQSHRQNQ